MEVRSHDMDLSLVKQEEPVDYVFVSECVDFKAENAFQMIEDQEKATESGLIEVFKQEPEYDGTGNESTNVFMPKYEVTEIEDSECDKMNAKLNEDSQDTKNTSSKQSLHDVRSFRCVKCSIITETKQSLVEHMKTQHPSEMVRCEICKRSYRQCNMPFHIRKHEGLQPYFCTICPKTFLSRGNWHNHKLMHEGKRFQCEFCEKLFIRKGGLKEHLQVHSRREKKFQCKICSIAYFRQTTLNRHNRRRHSRKLTHSTQNSISKNELDMSTDSDNKFYQCDICSNVYFTKKNLIEHFAFSHNITELKKFPCFLCKNVFAFSESLVEHIGSKNHNSLKVMPVFKSYSNHKRKIKLETQSKRFKCENCHQYFNSKRGKVFHMTNYCKLAETRQIKQEK